MGEALFQLRNVLTENFLETLFVSLEAPARLVVNWGIVELDQRGLLDFACFKVGDGLQQVSAVVIDGHSLLDNQSALPVLF